MVTWHFFDILCPQHSFFTPNYPCESLLSHSSGKLKLPRCHVQSPNPWCTGCVCHHKPKHDWRLVLRASSNINLEIFVLNNLTWLLDYVHLEYSQKINKKIIVCSVYSYLIKYICIYTYDSIYMYMIISKYVYMIIYTYADTNV